MKLRIAACALLATTGCRTTETRQVSANPTPVVRVGTRERMWEVRRGDELVGMVVLFQEHGAARDSVYFVRNPWHQDIGLIDGLGRAFRYLPHSEEPSWVGSGTIGLGTERILGLDGPCRLIEVDSSGARSGPAATSAGAERTSAPPSIRSPASEPLPPPSESARPRGGFAQYR